MRFVVKYFSEIIVKSKPVRNQFSKRLAENLRVRLKRVDKSIVVDRSWDKIIIDSNLDEASLQALLNIILTTPGVGQLLRVKSFPFTTVQQLAEQALLLYSKEIDRKHFVVRIKRSGKHDFTSSDVERELGGYLLHHSNAAGVKLKGADYTVKLEIRDDIVFAVEQQYQGIGGYPLGAMQPVLSLISGGFDSTVASFETMRRGMATHFIFFNLGGHAHEVGVQEVSYYLWNKFSNSQPVKFISVPFMDVVAEMLQSVPPSYRGVVLKRMMMRVASRVAEKMGIDALVTGEAIGQVASQTVPNLALIDAVAESLVLRPLITSDKESIIAVAKRIGTADFAASMPEYCGIISTKPVTAAKKDRVIDAEKNFDFTTLDQAIEASRLTDITLLDRLDKNAPEVEVLSIPVYGSVVIDIRHPDDIETKPLPLDTNIVENIPFFKLHKEAENLDKSKHYMLYCDRGVMSKLHAAHMKSEGFEKVSVYSVKVK